MTSPWRVALVVASAALPLAAVAALVAHLHSGVAVTHITGLLVMLAQLLREGVFYPEQPTPELVYSTYYQPLAFAPLALLPGTGLGLVPSLRLLVGIETLAAAGVAAALARRQGHDRAIAVQPALWTLATVPGAFALIGMRDDPRAVLLGMLAVLLYLRGSRRAPELAGLVLALAFFTKLTAPFAPGVALLVATMRSGRREVLRLLGAAALGVAVPFAVLQLVLHADLIGNPLRLALLDPPYVPRSAGATLEALARDVVQLEHGLLALPALVLASAGLLLARALRARFDLWDALVCGTWVKTWLAYRHPGTDLNHLFDLALVLPLHVSIRAGRWLTPGRALLALLVLLALGRPYELLWPVGKLPPLEECAAARVAAALRTLPKGTPTLCEDALVTLEAGLSPRVPDASTAAAALRAHPEVLETWFGPVDRPGALQRIVLLHDPFTPRAGFDPSRWYGVVDYDRAFVARLRDGWRVTYPGDDACVLERR